MIATARPRGRTSTWEPLPDEQFALVTSPAWAERVGAGRVTAEGPPRCTGCRSCRTRGSAHHAPLPRGFPAAVATGAGITVLPRHLRLAESASGALVPLPLPVPEDPPINTSYLTRHPGSSDNPHVTLVRERPLRAAPTR